MLVEIRNEKMRTFQVMLLGNDADNQVEVHEESEISFQRIQEHLQNGGSVFITSKPSEKIELPTMREKTRREDTPQEQSRRFTSTTCSKKGPQKTCTQQSLRLAFFSERRSSCWVHVPQGMLWALFLERIMCR